MSLKFWSVLPGFHFMFFIDIGGIFKISEICWDGSSSFVGARLFQIWSSIFIIDFPKFYICKNNILKRLPYALIFLKYFWYTKNPYIWVPRGSQIQKSWNLEVLVPHIIKPKFHQTKIDQNNYPELLNLFSKHIFYKNDPNHVNESLKLRFPIFAHSWEPFLVSGKWAVSRRQ